jgi:flagella basal body P-ring formation protein FlgA
MLVKSRGPLRLLNQGWRTYVAAATFGALLHAGSAQGQAAQQFESHQRIVDAATTALVAATQSAPAREDLKVEVHSIDPRLRVHRCRTSLQGFLPHGAKHRGHTTVGVRCADAKPWKLYLRAQIRRFEHIVHLRAPVYPRQALSHEDIELKRVDTSRLTGAYFDDPQLVLGKIVKRRIRAGTVLRANMLSIPKAVQRGQDVLIEADAGGIQIRAKGVALGTGQVGDVIKVKNHMSGRIVQAIIKAQGIVRVSV